MRARLIVKSPSIVAEIRPGKGDGRHIGASRPEGSGLPVTAMRQGHQVPEKRAAFPVRKDGHRVACHPESWFTAESILRVPRTVSPEKACGSQHVVPSGARDR